MLMRFMILLMQVLKSQNKTTPHIQLAIEDSYKRLLNPAISNEALQEAKADANSIQVLLITWTIVAGTLGRKRILRLIQVLDLVAKLFVLTKRGFAQRDHLSTRAQKKRRWR
jgi:uncharacterized protein